MERIDASAENLDQNVRQSLLSCTVAAILVWNSQLDKRKMGKLHEKLDCFIDFFWTNPAKSFPLGELSTKSGELLWNSGLGNLP